MDYEKTIIDFIDENWEKATNDNIIELEKLKNSKELCIFGAGLLGQCVASQFLNAGIKPSYFCDNNKDLAGTFIFEDIMCISFEELKEKKNEPYILLSTMYHKEISKQLRDNEINNFTIYRSFILEILNLTVENSKEDVKSNLVELLKICEDDQSKEIVFTKIQACLKASSYPENYEKVCESGQYFPSTIDFIDNNESFVDVGAFDGDTISEFLNATNNKFNKIYAYELDKNNYKKLVYNINMLETDISSKIEIYNVGVYDENKTVSYSIENTSSTIDEICEHIIDNIETGEVVRLSEHLVDKPVTYIKMDIEGAEIKAIEGAESIIRTQKPKMAICVYHKVSHLWEIPFLLKKFVPEYKIYLRHHTVLGFETVCYAKI